MIAFFSGTQTSFKTYLKRREDIVIEIRAGFVDDTVGNVTWEILVNKGLADRRRIIKT